MFDNNSTTTLNYPGRVSISEFCTIHFRLLGQAEVLKIDEFIENNNNNNDD